MREAAKLGFTYASISKANKPKQKIEGLEIIAVERVEQAVEYIAEEHKCAINEGVQNGWEEC